MAVIKVPDVFDLGLIALLYPFELPLEILLAFSLVLLQYFLRQLALVLVFFAMDSMHFWRATFRPRSCFSNSRFFLAESSLNFEKPHFLTACLAECSYSCSAGAELHRGHLSAAGSAAGWPDIMICIL